MSQYDEFDDLDDLDDDTRGSNALREVRKAQRAAEKRAKELEAELAKYRAEARQNTLKSLLTEKNLNPKIAAFIPADITEPEKVAAWLDEYGDVFSPAPVQQEAVVDQGQQAPPKADLFTQVASSGDSPHVDASNMASLIAGAKTAEELNQILFGNPSGPPVY